MAARNGSQVFGSEGPFLARNGSTVFGVAVEDEGGGGGEPGAATKRMFPIDQTRMFPLPTNTIRMTPVT
jgi:hypothetical protein